MSKKNNTFDQPGSLMLATIQKVKEIGTEEVAFKTGVPFGWLQKLCSGTFKNPSVNRIEHIYKVLSGTELL